MIEKEQLIESAINAAGDRTIEVHQIEVLADIRDQLKRIADLLEYAREALENWQRSPA